MIIQSILFLLNPVRHRRVTFTRNDNIWVTYRLHSLEDSSRKKVYGRLLPISLGTMEHNPLFRVNLENLKLKNTISLWDSVPITVTLCVHMGRLICWAECGDTEPHPCFPQEESWPNPKPDLCQCCCGCVYFLRKEEESKFSESHSCHEKKEKQTINIYYNHSIPWGLTPKMDLSFISAMSLMPIWRSHSSLHLFLSVRFIIEGSDTIKKLICIEHLLCTRHSTKPLKYITSLNC